MLKFKSFTLITFLLSLTFLGSCSDSSSTDKQVIQLPQVDIESIIDFSTYNLSFREACRGGKTRQKAIYGFDNRISHCSGSLSYEDTEKQKAVAMFVDTKQVKYIGVVEGKKVYKIEATTLSKHIEISTGANACSNMRYREEKAPGFCTGFLINENGRNDELMSAGHCIEDRAIADIKIIFTVSKDGREVVSNNELFSDEIFVSEDQVFDIRSSRSFIYDVSVLELDREVQGVEPLELSKEEFFYRGTKLQMMGHPVGLMMKVSDGEVSSDARKFEAITAHIASFGGNSGSPVFEKETGLVAGVLVSGQQDFEAVIKANEVCVGYKVFDRYSSAGEKVLKVGKLLY